MKVGDAGEAFFVFETEQEVPEEFATSPLAGPSQDKVEEEIDFLDLSQSSNKPLPSQPDDIGTWTTIKKMPLFFGRFVHTKTISC